MNHKSTARAFLNWFEQEALSQAEDGSIQYVGDFVMRYFDSNCRITRNAITYVRRICFERLNNDADIANVLREAEKFLAA